LGGKGTRRISNQAYGPERLPKVKRGKEKKDSSKTIFQGQKHGNRACRRQVTKLVRGKPIS